MEIKLICALLLWKYGGFGSGYGVRLLDYSQFGMRIPDGQLPVRRVTGAVKHQRPFFQEAGVRYLLRLAAGNPLLVARSLAAVRVRDAACRRRSRIPRRPGSFAATVTVRGPLWMPSGRRRVEFYLRIMKRKSQNVYRLSFTPVRARTLHPCRH